MAKSMKLLSAIALSCMVAACSTGNTAALDIYLNMLATKAGMRAAKAPPNNVGADYIVQFAEFDDPAFTHDVRNAADRQLLMARYFRNACPQATIIREETSEIEVGFFGQKQTIYHLMVSCNPAQTAQQPAQETAPLTYEVPPSQPSHPPVASGQDDVYGPLDHSF